MVSEVKTVKITRESDLDELLREAANEPLLLDKDGVLYRLSREDDVKDIWAGYDPDRARAVLDEVAGSWGDLDADQVIADLYEARERGSRSVDRP